MTLRLARLGRDAPDPLAMAIGMGPARITHAQLDTRCDSVARSFRSLGLVPGDRIALLLPGVPDFVVAFLGACRAGLVVIPLNPLLGVGELRGILQAMQPKVIVTLPQGTPLPAIAALPALRAEVAPEAIVYVSGQPGSLDLEQGAKAFADLQASGRDDGPVPGSLPGPLPGSPRDSSEEAVILFTSGTTGAPKGVSISEAALTQNALAVISQLAITSADVVLSPLPPSHVFGLVVGLIAGLAAGAGVVLVPRPTPDLVHEAMRDASPTLMLAVPATLAALVRIGEPAGGALRAVATGGAPLAPAVAADFSRIFGARVVQGYGMTETAGLISLPELAGRPDATKVGRVLAAFEHRVEPVDPATPDRGELLLRGGPLFRGFYIDGVFEPRDPATWFATGDLVEVDAEGQMTLYDRRKELIIRGGYNVYPSEVEAVLMSHPGVALAAVVGVADDEVGEEVAAFVTLMPQAEVAAGDLVAWSRAALATYKYPRHIVLLDELPLTPSGKILKRALPTDRIPGARLL